MSPDDRRTECPRPAGVECRDGGNHILETSCGYWPMNLTEARAQELGQRHEGHPVESCLVQLAVLAKVLEPLDGCTAVGHSRWLWADPWDWPELLAAGESPVCRITATPADDADLAELKAARAQRLARGGIS